MIQWAKFASRAKSIGSKAKGVAKKYPLSTTGAVSVSGGLAYIGTGGAAKAQNQKIEMQKIAKERKTRKISRQEIKSRLAKAKQSKREFTFI
jgi:hypothetical protein|tara:strand:- start:60 stop:335 length:276 start_codon:yes stop_codon:yes gene_type:complete